MKTLLAIALFPLLCSNAVMGQKVDTKTRMNALHKPLDYKDNHGFSDKGEKYEIQHLGIPKTHTGNQVKSALDLTQKLDSTIHETWDSAAGQLVVSEKSVYTYDANGNNSLRLDYLWDEITNQWFIAYKTEYYFDANGNNTLSINYNWLENPGELFKFYKGESTVDASGNETSYTGYFWVESSSEWIPSVKEEPTYNANGNVSLLKYYNWNETSQWVAYMKREYSYDLNGDMTLLYEAKLSSGTVFQWIPDRKEEYAYNTGDFTTLASVNYYNRDTAGTQWLVNAKDEYTYGDNGSVLIEYEYDADLSQWLNFRKITTTYDAYGNITTVNYLWNQTTSEWETDNRITDYYSQHDITGVPGIPERKISVYPNPASAYVIFDGLKVSGSAKVELFDMGGKKVLDQKLPESREISVGNLPKGLYLYRLSDRGNIYKGKIGVE